MNYENYTSGQKMLAHAIARKVEHSGCTKDECVQVLSDMIGSLLVYMAPSKAELTEYLDNKLIQSGFCEYNRLNIAAMAMQGMLSNPKITEYMEFQDATHTECLAVYALQYADVLIKEAEKGGDEDNEE